MYSNALQYLNTWTKQYDEFKIFKWMDLQEVPDFEDIQICVNYLQGKNVIISEDKCFDQFCNLKQFVTERQDHDDDDEFKKQFLHTTPTWSEFSTSLVCNGPTKEIVF